MLGQNIAVNQAPELRAVLLKAASSWPDLTPYVDPETNSVDANLVDVLFYASELMRHAQIELPLDLPDRESARKIVELVDGKFVSGPAGIRLLSKEVIAIRAIQVIADIEKDALLSFGGTGALLVALFMWHGCICMAKTLRKTYVTPDGEKPYSLERRKIGYAAIQQDWETAGREGNPWIRYGVSVAQRFALARGDSVSEDWVPKDSPYRE